MTDNDAAEDARRYAQHSQERGTRGELRLHPDIDDTQSPFARWLADRTQAVPLWTDGPDQVWLNAEPDHTVTAWCWPCTAGPEVWIARIPDEGHNPDYTEQITRAVLDHIQTAHADRKAPDG